MTDFNIFKSKIGTFKQHEGLPMGGSFSPVISNLFVHMLEKILVNKFIKEGKVKFWRRYADDFCAIISKNALDDIITRLNNWDSELWFTVNKMTNNSLVFLESKIFIFEN